MKWKVYKNGYWFNRVWWIVRSSRTMRNRVCNYVYNGRFQMKYNSLMDDPCDNVGHWVDFVMNRTANER